MRFERIRLGANTGFIDLLLAPMYFTDQTPSSGPYLLKGFDGLGPSTIDVNISGGQYRGRRPQEKQIIFRIGLLPDYETDQTASDLRDELYGLLTNPFGFDTNDVPIELMHLPDNPAEGWQIVAQITGYASKFEISPGKDPEVLVTFETTSAYLEAPQFESASPEIGSVLPDFNNPGTAASGFQLFLKFETPLSSWKITHAATGQFMEMVYPFAIGDILRVSTVEGERGIWIVDESSSETNIIWALTRGSTWLELFHGPNAFLVSSDQFTWVDFHPGFHWLPQYWGI